MSDLFSPKQVEFMVNANKRWNLAHGAVSTGKTIGVTAAFMFAVDACPDSSIYIVGHSSDTSYRNVIRPLLESEELKMFRPFCTWRPKKGLLFKDKNIEVIGAKDEGSIRKFQGLSASLIYCDEMTLYPSSVIQMIDTRLRKAHSKGYAAMNPTFPGHECKKWIDMGEAGDPNYYSQHYVLNDNPFISEDYKQRIIHSTSGVFYKRNVLGLWCLAEGAVFEFFDEKIHVIDKPKRCADYWIAGIDFGTSNAFACVLIGVSTGINNQMPKQLWVEKEYYWDSKAKGRQKLNSEYADDVVNFLSDYAPKGIYMDPSAAAMRLELQRRGMHIISADNDVYNGIQVMTNEMAEGKLYVCKSCPNLIKEIQNYVWDKKKSEQGEDEPVKKGDHAVDALRYAIYNHKVPTYQPYKDQKPDDYLKSRFQPTRRM